MLRRRSPQRDAGAPSLGNPEQLLLAHGSPLLLETRNVNHHRQFQIDRTGDPCQRFARNYATRSLNPPHDTTPDSASHLRGCVGTCGTARRCEPPEHQWHVGAQSRLRCNTGRRSRGISALGSRATDTRSPRLGRAHDASSAAGCPLGHCGPVTTAGLPRSVGPGTGVDRAAGVCRSHHESITAGQDSTCRWLV
jgi:hypothetical protein